VCACEGPCRHTVRANPHARCCGCRVLAGRSAQLRPCGGARACRRAAPAARIPFWPLVCRSPKSSLVLRSARARAPVWLRFHSASVQARTLGVDVRSGESVAHAHTLLTYDGTSAQCLWRTTWHFRTHGSRGGSPARASFTRCGGLLRKLTESCASLWELRGSFWRRQTPRFPARLRSLRRRGCLH
jgi:hypothetical protein